VQINKSIFVSIIDKREMEMGREMKMEMGEGERDRLRGR
jgi:hypothetical protein